MTFAEDTEVEAGDWTQKQWWNTAKENNQYRFKLQHIEGAQVTDLFTSDDKN